MIRKHFYLWLVSAMLIGGALVSCGDDDEKPDNNENPGNQTEPDNNQQNPDPNNGQETPVDDKTYTPLQTSAGTIPATAISLADAKNPAEVMKAMGMGWNLGNQFDAHNNGVSSETAWSQPKATQETFNKVAAAGIKTVRIPVTWMGHIGGGPDYKIEDAWLNRIYEVVGYAENAGLNAIINIHHDGANSEHWLDIKNCAKDATKQKNTVAKLSALWKQIAEKFKDKGHFLMFEAMNEIQDGGWGWGDNRKDGGKQYAAMNEWLQAVVDAIRATGGKNTDRWIGIPSYDTDIDLCEQLVLPYDPAHKLMVSVHYYSPYEYTLEYQYQQWGHTAKADKTTNYGQEKDCQTQMKKMYSRYTSKGIPVYVGEIGNVNRLNSNEKYRKYYFEYVAKCIHDNYMSAILWDNGVAKSGKECHGYFNHGTGEWMNDYSEQMIQVLVKAMTTEDENYTLQSIYDAME
ncbi:MAG: glycoside hydrolase family 5 protein [Bacteroidales bacterium]|nr:glycoside hydrolase family 5 protein [Bacteroidales bacterium]